MLKNNRANIINLDNTIISANTYIKPHECLYFLDNTTNSTNKYLEYNNSKFSQDLKIGENILGDYINTYTIYNEHNAYIYMNTIFNTEIIFRYVHPKTSYIEIPCCFYIDNPWSENFYHFIVEVLPYIIYLNRLDDNIPFLICGGDTELLQYFNIKNPIIQRVENNIYKVEDLIYTKSILNFPIKNNIEIIKSRLPSNYTPKYGIIINRSKSRIILNVDLLYRAIKNKYTNLEWIIIDDDMKPLEYIDYFINCQIIIGAHGAGLTNMIFSPNPDLIVIEIMPIGFYVLCFSILASQCGIKNFHSIVVDSYDEDNNIMLDIDLFITLIKNLLI
jgi:hypothetical protein